MDDARVDREYESLSRLVPLVADGMRRAMEESIAEINEAHPDGHVAVNEVLNGIWENVTNMGVRMVTGTRRGVMQGVGAAIEDAIERMGSNAEGLDPQNTAADWLDGWLSAMDSVRRMVDDQRDDAADEVTPDMGALALRVEECVGPIPGEVVDWLTTIASGRLIDPVGWLRASMQGVVE